MATAQNKSNQGGEKYWRAHITALSKSGLSRAEYCRRWELSYHAMTYWREKLSGTNPAVPTLVPVSVPAVIQSREPRPDQSWLRLVLPNRFAIDIGDNFSPDTLLRVLTTLEGR